MSKFPKLTLILLILILAGCNKPQVVPKVVPSETTPPDTITPQPSLTDTATATSAPAPSDTPDPGAILVTPTINMTQVMEGEVKPLLPAGTEITLHWIQMVDDLIGWGVGIADTDTRHIFHTEDGGITWEDVSPPQPFDPRITEYVPATLGVWDGDTAWVAYDGAEYIWSTENGGTTWEAALITYETRLDGIFAVLDNYHSWFFQFLDAGMQKVYTAVYRTVDGGRTWEMLLDPYTDINIQGFDKTGVVFINPQFGWLTRHFRGVDPKVRINFTQDGGATWDAIELPTPPGLPDVFMSGIGALFDPYLISPEQGSMRVLTRRHENDEVIDQTFLYLTNDGGSTWEIQDIPNGDLYHITDEILYSVSRDIYRSEDGGANWQFVKSVNWDGQFSFVDQNTAWVVAYNGYEYALVKTTNGCQSFFEIEPVLVTSSAVR